MEIPPLPGQRQLRQASFTCRGGGRRLVLGRAGRARGLQGSRSLCLWGRENVTACWGEDTCGVSRVQPQRGGQRGLSVEHRGSQM